MRRSRSRMLSRSASFQFDEIFVIIRGRHGLPRLELGKIQSIFFCIAPILFLVFIAGSPGSSLRLEPDVATPMLRPDPDPDVATRPRCATPTPMCDPDPDVRPCRCA